MDYLKKIRNSSRNALRSTRAKMSNVGSKVKNTIPTKNNVLRRARSLRNKTKNRVTSLRKGVSNGALNIRKRSRNTFKKIRNKTTNSMRRLSRKRILIINN